MTFYTVDTRGLSLQSPLAVSQALMTQAINENSARQNVTFSDMNGFNDAELSATGNVQSNLAMLAQATGGFAVTNTNEIAKPMQRIMEDIRTHYEVSYTPSSDNYNGQFRHITVKIADRPKLIVQTRSGYYALPDLNGHPVQPYEMAALKALSQNPLPHAFPFQGELMQFRPLSNGAECELAFGIPISALKITKNTKAKAGRMHLSVFALIHDSSGRIIDLVTRDLGREMKLSELPAVRNEWITYIQPVHLPAGHYTIDAAVVDEQGGQASAERLAAFVSGPRGISLSSIAVIQHVEPLPNATEPGTPFDIGQARILPAVNQVLPAAKPVGLYFVVYPSAGTTGKPAVTVELFRDGKVAARNSPPIPKAEENGSLPFVIQLSLKPGDYEVRVTARQAGSAAQTATALVIE